MGTGLRLRAPRLVGAHADRAESASSLSIASPGRTRAGDLLLVSIAISGQPPNPVQPPEPITPPADWELIRRDDQTLAKATFFHVLQSDDPSSWNWSWEGPRDASYTALAYRGQDPDDPIDANSGRGTTGSDTLVAPSVRTRRDDCVLVGLFSAKEGTLSPPREMEQRAYPPEPTAPVSMAADEPWPDAGATGDRSAGASTPTDGVGQLVAIAPGRRVAGAFWFSSAWALVVGALVALLLALGASYFIVVLRSSSDVVACTAEELQIQALEAAGGGTAGQGTLAAGGPLAQELTACPGVDYGDPGTGE